MSLQMESNEELVLTKICSTCQQVLQATSGVIDMDEVEYQTFEKFCEAAEDGCFLCFQIRSAMIRRNVFDTMDESSWSPPTFDIIDGEANGKCLVTESPAGMNTDLYWELSPLGDHPYGPNLTFGFERHTSSISGLNLALAWLQRCLSTHQRCTTLSRLNPQWLPTRLIDVGLDDNDHWRLIETAKEVQAGTALPYMTLSYRWGSHPKILLKSSSLESFKSENSIGQLPLAFRDAIGVVRHFGIRYLWIDSLCIMQDSVSDWEAEAPMMRYVYGNSTCNLAASASYDPDDGLFRERDPARMGPHVVESTLSNGSLQKNLIVTVGYWPERIDDGVLHNRGWVFQECLLAPRVMYFTKEQLMWECTETHGCEAFPDGVHLTWPTKLDVEKAFENNEAKFVNFDLGPFAHAGVWMSLVQEYTSTKLTRPDDRLYAFSGIAKLFQEITGYKYLAGVWQEDLLHQLGWYVDYPAPKLSNRYRAPSWSWASTDGRVMPNAENDTEFLIQIIDVNVTARGTDPTLDAADGYLKLRCPFIVASYFRTSEGDIRLEFGGARSATFSRYKPDRQEEQRLTENGTIELFFYGRQKWSSGQCLLECIVVESIPGDDDTFRRTGMISILDEKDIIAAMDMIEDGTIGSKTITLV